MPANNRAMPKIQKSPQGRCWDFRVCAAPDCDKRIHRFMKERWGKKYHSGRMPTNDRETATGTTEAGEAGPTVRVRESKEDSALRGVPTVDGTERQQEMPAYASLIRPAGLRRVCLYPTGVG